MADKQKDKPAAEPQEETEHTGESPSPGHRDAGQVQKDAADAAAEE